MIYTHRAPEINSDIQPTYLSLDTSSKQAAGRANNKIKIYADVGSDKLPHGKLD